MKMNHYKEFTMYKDEPFVQKPPRIVPEKANHSHTKVRPSLANVLDEIHLQDGMTLSFHHHLRNGDYVLNTVMKEIANRGIKDIRLFASSIFPCHEMLVPLIEQGIVTQIYAAYISGPVAEAISYGKLAKVAVMHTHGGRVRLVQSGDVQIDVAFIASPTCDRMGNLTGSIGKNACGALGYAYTDAVFATQSVVITDHLVDELTDFQIEGKWIDYIVPVETIGDALGIVSGTTKITKNPIGLKIAKMATDVIFYSGYFKPGFSFQTGAGGTSLAVAAFLKERMKQTGVTGSFASGGITSYLVDMLKDGLFETLYDVQCFDLDAVQSIRENSHHLPISASKYANVYDKCIVDDLDFVILGATEIDLNFNVNVTTSSTGMIMGGSGGHSDTAQGAKVTIIVSQLFNARIPVIKDQVICKTTPGSSIDVLVTERGIAVNPLRPDLIEKFKAHHLPLKTIEELKQITDSMCGIPQEISFTDRIVSVVEYRDGRVIDFIFQKQMN